MNSEVLNRARGQTCKALDELRGRDMENDHIMADNLIVDFLKTIGERDVAETFERARKRVPFAYS